MPIMSWNLIVMQVVKRVALSTISSGIFDFLDSCTTLVSIRLFRLIGNIFTESLERLVVICPHQNTRLFYENDQAELEIWLTESMKSILILIIKELVMKKINRTLKNTKQLESFSWWRRMVIIKLGMSMKILIIN